MNLVIRTMPGAPALSFGERPGDGPALLLLHGVTRGWRDWEPLFPLLAERWHLYALDARGHGGSERAEGYQVVHYVRDTVRFVDAQVGRPVVILGHSLGAMVAAAVAAELPRLVLGVVLEDPPFHAMGRQIHGSAWQSQFRGMRDVAQRGGSVEQLAQGLAEIQLPGPGGGSRRLGDLRPPEAIRWSAECLATLDPEVLTPLVVGTWLDGYDPVSVASRVRCHMHLLQADPEVGGALSDDEASAFASAVANCRHQRIAGTNHLVHWQDPESVAAAVNQFLVREKPL